MSKELDVLDEIKSKICNIRGKQVMLDSDLAKIYGVEVKNLKRQVRRNKERFLDEFMFQLTPEEFLRCQNVTSKTGRGGIRYYPYAFTEQGVAMLTTVLKSDKAIKASINIMKAFVAMRKFLSENKDLFNKLSIVESKILEHDKNFEKVFKALDDKNLPEKGIFFEGQVFDAYKFITDLIKSANKRIVLIDNYADTQTLELLANTKTNVKIKIYTKNTKSLEQAVFKFNEQHQHLEIFKFEKSHDRFLIIDDDLYHIGASLKDLGKKWFIHNEIVNVPKTECF